MIFELEKDFADALAVLPADHPKRRMLGLLREAVRRDIHFVARHPATIFQCMWNTCWWYDCPGAVKHDEESQGGGPAGRGASLRPRPRGRIQRLRRAREQDYA